MAIVQASIQEEVLPRSERAVIRGIYHASQLSEALVTLSRIEECLGSINSASRLGTKNTIETHDTISSMKAYLSSQIANALVSTKLPATKNTVSTPTIQKSVQ